MEKTLGNQLMGDAVDMISNLAILSEAKVSKPLLELNLGLQLGGSDEDFLKPGELLQASISEATLVGSDAAGDAAGDSLANHGARSGRRLSLHTLAQIVLLLQKRLAHTKAMGEFVDVTNDVAYWRALAQSRGEEINRFISVIELQKLRIDTLERDLGTLVRLAQETQKMLADISPEKPSNPPAP